METTKTVKETVLERLRAGECASAIARELNLNPKTVQKWGQRAKVQTVKVISPAGLHDGKRSRRAVHAAGPAAALSFLTEPQSVNTTAGLTPGTDRATVSALMDKVSRLVQVPRDFPVDHATWKDEVALMLQLFIWKAAQRMVNEVDTMNIDRLPVNSAVAMDKLSGLRGEPSSIHAMIHASFTPASMLANLSTAKPAQVALDQPAAPVATTCAEPGQEVS